MTRFGSPNDLPAQPGLRVLSVEDDMLVAMGTTGMLEDLGHIVTEASSAEQALALIQAGLDVDMLVTDQGMAGMTGYALAEAIQRQTSGMPVVLVTGYMQLPADADPTIVVLHKPFRASELAEAILRAQSRVLEPMNRTSAASP